MTMKTLLDVVYDASKGLRVIDPHDKGTDDAEIMIARAAIAGAQRIFIWVMDLMNITVAGWTFESISVIRRWRHSATGGSPSQIVRT
jgi:hypothetical protein